MQKHHTGFTLIELIMVIVLTGTVALLITQIMRRPISDYFDQQRRITLVEQAQLTLEKMAADLEQALPNSIRIDASGEVLEFMPIIAAGRYREGSAGDRNGLATNIPDREFNMLGDIDNNLTGRVVVYNTSPATLYDDATGSAPANTGVITEAGNLASITTCYLDTVGDSDCSDAGADGTWLEQSDRITLDSNHRFDPGGTGSPAHRFYLVEGAATYICQPSTGKLEIIKGYAISASQITDLATLNSTATGRSVLSDKIKSCQFVFEPGNSSYRAAMVTIRLTLEAENERIELIRQVYLWNAP